MILKGIARGDGGFRHFTFDDDKPILKNGVYYYEVNYGKNPLEGEYAEEEKGFIPCDRVMCLGGKKPKPLPTTEPKPEVKKIEPIVVEPITIEPKRGRGRPKKTEVSGVEDIPYTDTVISKFEYLVKELHSNNIQNLQDQLNEVGFQGWELCGFDTNKNLFGESNFIVILKRKRG